MTPHSFIGGLTTVLIGGGIATGLGFALKPSSKGSILDENAPPNH